MIIAGIATTLAVFAATPASAAAGDLDTSFDNDGAAVTDFYSGTEDRAEAVAIQSDGKIVAVGRRGGGAIRDNFAVARYNQNGSLDEGFGTQGRTMTDFDGDDDVANGVAVQRDGKIVVVGTARIENKPTDFAIARYTTEGKLDKTFAGDGRLTFGFNAYDEAHDVAIQPDGKIVVVGRRFGNNVPADFTLARITSTGQLDTSFSDDGKVATGFGGGEAAYAVALQRDGKIVAAGRKHDDDYDYDFALARYNTNGSLDKTFDGDGKLTTGLGENDIALDVAIQPDGRIVAAGKKEVAETFASDIAATRYNIDGSLDRTFDGDGKLTVNLGSKEWANGVAVQQDGKLVVGGVSYLTGSNPYNYTDYFVARLTTSGALDGTFSGDGRFVGGVSESDGITGLTLQSDGKIVACGYSHDGPSSDDSDMTVWRFRTV
jgi:uncharacterized delta-60 repeat protein